MNGFGQRLKVVRESRKMTQEDLAEKAGLPHSAISKIEKGTQAVKTHQAEAMAGARGVDVRLLFGEEPVAPHLDALYHALRSRSVESRQECAVLLRIIADNIITIPPTLSAGKGNHH